MLSVVIITKNEEHNLPRCLASVRGVAEEVIVVDSGSEDKTVQIAQAHGARVYDREFHSYADQKNWASEKATQPFVLSLDADEALSDPLVDELLLWKQNTSNGEQKAWSMPRLTSYCGTWIRNGGWYPDRKIRLWAKGCGQWSTDRKGDVLHEAWVPREGLQIESFASDLLHYSYHSTEDHLRQLSKFAWLGAVDASNAGRGSSRLKPFVRAGFQWLKQFVFQSGWRDGWAGFEVARWSAVAAYWKWTIVRKSAPFKTAKRIGVVRTDALGDNVVSLPIAGALKAMLPEVEIVWICRPYARRVAARSVVVDEVRCWDESSEDVNSWLALFNDLDAVIFAFPEPKLMWVAARANVQTRVATGRRWSGFLWANHRSFRSRRARQEHETMQGLRLLHHLSIPARYLFPRFRDWHALTGLSRPSTVTSNNGIEFPIEQSIVLHPGNHGSANGWPLERFELLAEKLVQAGHHVIVTGSENEREFLGSWIERVESHAQMMNAVGRWTLDEFMDALASARVVVASSTGPLHLASALGTPTVGLYRASAPFWPERWAPLGIGIVMSTNDVLPEGGLNLEVDNVFASVENLLQTSAESEG